MANAQISTGITIINSLLGYIGISLTNQSTSASTAIASGSKVEIAGSFFTFTSDETPLASTWTSMTTGANAYIALTPSGTAGSQIVTASWVGTASAVWSDAKQGYYTSASSNIRVVASAYKTSPTQYDNKMVLTQKNENAVPYDAVENSKLANMNGSTIKGQIVGGSGDPVDMTPAQAAAVIGSAVSPQVTDLDALTGSKPFGFTNTATGAPVVGTLGFPASAYDAIGWQVEATGQLTQFAHAASGSFAVRVNDSGSWGSWARIFTDNTSVTALSVLGRSASTAGVIEDIAAGTDGHVLRRSGTSIGFGTVARAGLSDASASTIMGRAVGAGAGAPTDLTGSQVSAIINAGASNYLTGSKTHDEIFDALSPWIPNIGDKIMLTGGFYKSSSALIHIALYARRSSTANTVFGCISPSGTAFFETLAVVDGSGATWGDMAIGWIG